MKRQKTSKLFSHIEKELHRESGKILESLQLTSVEKTIQSLKTIKVCHDKKF